MQKTLTTTFVSLFSEHINGFSSEIQQSNGRVYLEWYIDLTDFA